MKVIFGAFPDFRHNLSDSYDFVPVRGKLTEKKSTHSFLIMIFIFYSLCFGLGYSMFAYHERFIHSFFYFCIFFILSSFIVIPLHLLLQVIFYPCKLSDRECYIGFNYRFFTPFTCYMGPTKRQRLILGSLLPFILMTVFPLAVITLTSANMLLYGIASVNGLISVYDLYDFLILMSKEVSKGNILIKSNNIFYLLKKKERKILAKPDSNIRQKDSPTKVFIKNKKPSRRKSRNKKKKKHS
ncbi:DUF3267 domain-containing protein [Clostridium paraputrificum]|uniref:DUF3267 domain-containing protein n=1 Tax=Clostridium paraputrificum TaxID=29363 RepID=UPI003D358DFB